MFKVFTQMKSLDIFMKVFLIAKKTGKNKNLYCLTKQAIPQNPLF